MTLSHLARLQRIRELLRERGGVRAERTRLLCFSGAGFSADLEEAAAHDPAVQLVGLERLYEGA